MLKYIVLAAVFIVAVLIGKVLSQRLKMRAYCLELVSQMISEAVVQIRYISPTFERLVSDFAEKGRYDELDFVKATVSYTESTDIRTAWKTAVSETSLPLDKKDIEVLQTIGSFLGTSDIDGQISMLETQLSALQTEKEKASADYERKGKMYCSVSLLIGLGICIILF